jgi:hypothetical protein
MAARVAPSEPGSLERLLASLSAGGAPESLDALWLPSRAAAPDPDEEDEDDDEDDDVKDDGNIDPDDDEGYGDDEEDEDDEEPLQVAPGLLRAALRGCCGAESAPGARTGRRTRHTSPSSR